MMGARFTDAMLHAAEAVINRGLRLDAAALPRLAELSGTCIALEVTDINWVIYMLPGTAGLSLRRDYPGVPDARLNGAGWALLRLGMHKGNARAALSASGVQISGDIELVQQLKRILDAIEIDWEELLSKLVGDLCARKLANALRDTRRWGVRTAESLAYNFAEYQQEESRTLPTRAEMEEFLAEVDATRDDVERVEARLRRLQRAALALPETVQGTPLSRAAKESH